MLDRYGMVFFYIPLRKGKEILRTRIILIGREGREAYYYCRIICVTKVVLLVGHYYVLDEQ